MQKVDKQTKLVGVAVVGAIVMFMFGFNVGGGGETRVETRTVEVKAEPEQIETTKEVKVEVPVPAELPQSCVDLIGEVNRLSDNDSAFTAAAGQLSLAADNVRKYSVQGDPTNGSQALQDLYDAKEALNTEAVGRGEITTFVNTKLEICQAEIEAEGR